MKTFFLALTLTICAFTSRVEAQRVTKTERLKLEKTVTAPDPSTGHYLQRLGTGDTLVWINNGVRYYLYPVSANSASVLGLRDTTTKAFGFYNVSATDSSILLEARETGDTVREIRAIRVGGTSASINVTKNGSSDLLTANYATSTSEASAGTLQNNGLAQGDIVRVAVRAISGTVTEIFVQLTITHNQH